MANKIVLKKSSVASKVPLASDLDFGELAINYTDSKLYFKKADGTTIDSFSTEPAPVTSVAGKTGVVTLTSSDVGLGNVDNTSDATKNSATATLTNKTIDGTNNIITNVSLTSGITDTLPVANGGTGATTLAINNVLLGNDTGALQVVAPGTSGNVLTSNGTTWISSPSSGSGSGSGSLIFISSQTVETSVAAIDFTSDISSTYDDYVVYFNNLTSDTSNNTFRIRFYKNGTLITTLSYSFAYGWSRQTPLSAGAQATSIPITNNDVTTTSFVSGVCHFMDMNSDLTNRSRVIGDIFYNHSTASQTTRGVFGGTLTTASATTGFRFYPNSGNFVSGTFRLYGVKKS